MSAVHLEECPARHVPTARCDWCEWALHTPEVRLLDAVLHDADRLLVAPQTATVAGAVATRRLRDLVAAWEPDGTAHQSVVRTTTELHRRAIDAVERLHARVARDTAVGGPVDRLVRETAATLASVALQTVADDERFAWLPPATRRRVERLGASLSPTTQTELLIPVLDHLHWQGLPELRTQPEWARRPRVHRRARIAERQLAGAKVEPGSLEALVVESLAGEQTEAMSSLGHELAELPLQPTTTIQINSRRHPGGRARALVWRLAAFDWHATLADTGLASCWRVVDETTYEVPWFVGLAVEHARAHGQVSALSP